MSHETTCCSLRSSPVCQAFVVLAAKTTFQGSPEYPLLLKSRTSTVSCHIITISANNMDDDKDDTAMCLV